MNTGYTQETRLDKLRERYNFVGTNLEFLDFLRSLFPLMPTEPQDIRRDMTRYYILDESPVRRENSTKLATEDKFFYQNLQVGRAILDTLLGMPVEKFIELLDQKRQGRW